jgi:hypothetical protein
MRLYVQLKLSSTSSTRRAPQVKRERSISRRKLAAARFNPPKSVFKKNPFDARLPLLQDSACTLCASGEQSEAFLKATVRKVRTLTGEILYPKPDGYRAHRKFQDGFPNYEAPSPIRHRLSPISRRQSPFYRRRSPMQKLPSPFSDGRPQFPNHFPQFFRLAPHLPEGFPQFPSHVPQFFCR